MKKIKTLLILVIKALIILAAAGILITHLNPSASNHNQVNAHAPSYVEKKVKIGNDYYTARDDGYVFDARGKIVDDRHILEAIQEAKPYVKPTTRYDMGGIIASAAGSAVRIGVVILALYVLGFNKFINWVKKQ